MSFKALQSRKPMKPQIDALMESDDWDKIPEEVQFALEVLADKAELNDGGISSEEDAKQFMDSLKEDGASASIVELLIDSDMDSMIDHVGARRSADQKFDELAREVVTLMEGMLGHETKPKPGSQDDQISSLSRDKLTKLAPAAVIAVHGEMITLFCNQLADFDGAPPDLFAIRDRCPEDEPDSDSQKIARLRARADRAFVAGLLQCAMHELIARIGGADSFAAIQQKLINLATARHDKN